MFRLKKLEILGFKSFVDRTSLTLPGRITAIVGPNGSGKSNIVDSVQWVLGEQSARVLRGNTMEDVIFNGSARRRPLGMAEVSLTLESRGGVHWADTGGEVTITRRVSRDGESDYILNGKKARLKDVQDLLLGTGLGVRAYSIIEQQKIDMILSTKPQDRRRLIEEAAGISKYKIRKRQAEVKLEETRANLLRLSDLVSEVERTCTSLKRQAGRAARWKEQADVLAVLKKTLARLRADRLHTSLAAAEASLAAFTSSEAEALSSAGGLDAALEESRRLADDDDRIRRELGDLLARAREELLSAESAVARAAREAEEADARTELLETQRKEAEADHLRSAEEAGRADRLREEVEAELTAAEETARMTAAELAMAARREDDLSARRESARREILTAGARTAEAANRERESSLLVDRLTFALSKLAERQEQAGKALTLRRAATEEALAAEEATARALESCRARLEATGLDRKGAEERIKGLSDEREGAQGRFHALDRQIASLEATLALRETGGESARKALESSGVTPRGVLGDHFEPTEGFEAALDAALGGALEAPVLGTRAALDAALQAVRGGGNGTARFVHPIPDTPFPLKPHDPRVLGIARDLLSPRPGGEDLAGALPDAILVATLDDALDLAGVHPERTIVTRDGVVVRGSIVEVAGTDVPGEGLFTVRRDLKRLVSERETLGERLAVLEGEISGTTTRAGELARNLEEAFAASRKAERDHSEAQTRLTAARNEEQRTDREIQVLGEEETHVRTDLARATESRGEAAQLYGQRSHEAHEVESSITSLEEEAATLRAARLASAEGDAAARSARDLLAERRRSAAAAHETHRSRAEGAARRLSDIAEALLEVADRKRQAGLAGEKAEVRRSASVEAVRLAQDRRVASDQAAEERHRILEETTRQAHEAREKLDGIRRARFDAELVLERKKADRDHLLETCHADFGCAPEELPEVPLGQDGALPDEEESAAEVTRVTLALEKLGPVNHAALEEFDVESKRLQEMSTQKLDLEKSLEQILETIRTINITSSERFQAAFVAINANFGQVFQRLFRGGSASMQLLNEDDPLDSGLEIMAQPPGKRNQTIGLLSGGEKALTAVALLVAIFQYKPSPFCILDEVDAPLDEANIDRFTSLLQELSEETQFVLITHSKRTMEAAQALYGVTQEEPGVSKIVSVRFD
jgi:chromosome segregation protein